MISKVHFLKGTKYCFCDNFECIENYDLAIEDTKTTWSCHHKLEAFFSAKELQEMNRYYHVSPKELVFVQESGNGDRTHHYYWPHASRKGICEWARNNEPWNKGKKIGPLPEETCRKMSESHKGKSTWNKGLKTGSLSEETKKKISTSHKGKKHNYYSKGNKGMHWYNNGIVQMQAFECPNGFVPGRLPKSGT